MPEHSRPASKRVRPSAKLRIVLHDRAHQRFVPRLPDGGVLLGVVERGMHIGALARLHDGTFVQINGDVIQALNELAPEKWTPRGLLF